MRLLPFSRRLLKGRRFFKKLSTINYQLSTSKAFSLIELMLVIALMAVLTAGAIPSFSDFVRSQNLFQSAKTLKSDLRVTQSKSLSGAAADTSGNGKAWGLHFPAAGGTSYTIFTCPPVSSLSQYGNYVLSSNPACTTYKVVNLGNNVKISFISPSAAWGLDVVFDAQNGATVANGAQPVGNVVVSLDYISGTSNSQTLTITQGGGIVD